MKTIFSAAFVVLAVGTGLAFSQGQGTPDASKKIEVLENDLISTRQKTEAMVLELVETKTMLAKTIQYLDAQAKNAAAMSAALDDSERAGFTFGINPESRQILLRGWREQLAAMQAEVPTLTVAPKTDVPKLGDVKTKK